MNEDLEAREYSLRIGFSPGKDCLIFRGHGWFLS